MSKGKSGLGYKGPGKSKGSVGVGKRPVGGAPSFCVPNDSGKGRKGSK